MNRINLGGFADKTEDFEEFDQKSGREGILMANVDLPFKDCQSLELLIKTEQPGDPMMIKILIKVNLSPP